MQNLGVLLPWLDIAGLSVFAVSGVLVAVKKRVDFVGACFFAIVTAVGGGTLRDLLIDAPIFWMQDPLPIVLCVAVAIVAWLVPLRWWPERALEWFDAAGLAAYSVYGASKALQFGVSPTSALFVGLTWLGLASPWPAVLGVGLGFGLRGAAIRWNLSLPPHRGS